MILLMSLALANPTATPTEKIDWSCCELQTVDTLSFTFNVEIDGALKASRVWRWNIESGEVGLKDGDDWTSYTFGSPQGEAQQKLDGMFINDSFWLMPLMHLKWRSPDTLLQWTTVQESPFGPSDVAEVVFPKTGGHTPGDRYELFLEDGVMVGWRYFPGAQAEPAVTTTFTDYQQVGPLKIATEHRSPDGVFRLYFSDLSATPKTP